MTTESSTLNWTTPLRGCIVKLSVDDSLLYFKMRKNVNRRIYIEKNNQFECK